MSVRSRLLLGLGLFVCLGLTGLAYGWVDGWFDSSPAKPGDPVTLLPRAAFVDGSMDVVFLGDTLVGVAGGKKVLKSQGYDALFVPFQEYLAGADFVVLNLETSVTDKKRKAVKDKWYYKMPSRHLKAMVDRGVRVFNLANNHVMDYGPESLDDFLAVCEEQGVSCYGAGTNKVKAWTPSILEKNGLKVALFAGLENVKKYRNLNWYAKKDTKGVARLSLSQFKKFVPAVRPTVHATVLSPHWFVNYKPVSNAMRKTMADFVKTGLVDAVIGHGAHIVQEAEMVGGIPVLYGIGNFLFSTSGRYPDFKADAVAYGLVTRVRFDGHGVRRITLTPFKTDNLKVNYIPQIATEDEAKALFELILKPLSGQVRLSGNQAILEFAVSKS